MRLAWDSESRRERGEGYQRERSADLYHSSRWTRLSKAFRASHPLCEECRRQGLTVPATCVDHIVPFPVCDNFFDTKNLQALCDRCNMLKGEKDRATIQAWKKQREGGENL